MKKILGILVLLLMLAQAPAFAAGIEVQPTIMSRSNAQDRVWVGTFQLVWNDFVDKVIHNPVRFREGTPLMVYELNQKTFTTNDLSEDSYYTMVGKVNKNTKKTIAKAIKKKFRETSDLLDKLDLVPRNDMLIVYAMLKKDFEFKNEFKKLGKSLFGEEQTAEYFGLEKTRDENVRSGINVLFYNSSKDFAVKLATKGKDEVYLYKNPSNKAFAYIYADMMKKQRVFNGEKKFTSSDELKVPNIKFFEEKSFDELTGKRIMGTNLVINQAMETIKFDMNNKGVKVKSEAAMTVMTTALAPEEEARMFAFDDTFVIFLKEKGKNSPYLALRVNDIEKFQK